MTRYVALWVFLLSLLLLSKSLSEPVIATKNGPVKQFQLVSPERGVASKMTPDLEIEWVPRSEVPKN